MTAILTCHVALAIAVLGQGLGHVLEVEEDFIAFAARELGSRPVLPATTYLYTDYEAGSLYVAAWTAPFVRVLGANLLAVKLASVALAAVMVALVGWSGRRLVGPRAALVAAAVVAAGPPALIVRALQALGDTSEVLPLLLVQWALFSRRLLGGGGTHARMAFALGGVGGLAVGFSLASVPFQLALGLLAWTVRPSLREWVAVVAGFIAGLTIPIWNLAVHGIAFWNVRGASLSAGFAWPTDWLAGGLSLFARDAPGFFLEDFPYELVPGAAQLPRLYAIALHGAWLAAVLIHRRELLALARALFPGHGAARPPSGPAILVVLHAAFGAAWLATRYTSGYLLALLVPSGALLLAHVLGRVWARGSRLAAALACMGVIALELFPLAMLWHPGPTQPMFDAPAGAGGRWRGFLRARAHLRGAPQRAATLGDVARLVALEAADASEMFGAGHALALAYDGEVAARELPGALLAMAPAQAVELARGYGYGRAWAGENRQREGLLGLVAMGTGRHDALFGFGRCLGERFARRGARELGGDLLDPLASADREVVVFGLGYGYGWRLWHHPGYFQHEVLGLARADRQPLVQGLVARLEELGPPSSWPARLADLDSPLSDALPEEWRRRIER